MRRTALWAFCLCCYFFSSADASRAASQLDNVLREWITHNIALERTADGRDVLLLRKRPIKAYIRIDDPEIAADARIAIANFAEAYGLELEFTSSNINMVVATADRIADRAGKPSMTLLRSFGLSGSDADYIADADWSTGCGLYISRAPEERFLTFSIIAGTKELPKEQLRSCVVTGVIAGFGLRAHGTKIINHSIGYLQFLLLGRAVKECDGEITVAKAQPSSADVLVECIYRKLRVKFGE